MTWWALAALATGTADAAPDACSGEGVHFDVMTWNAWGLPFPLAAPRRARFKDVDRTIHAPGHDLVALQEVWRGSRGLLRKDDTYFPPDTDDDSGLALVSHLRVRAPILHPFSRATGFDAVKGKGVLVSSVEVPDIGDVQVFVTHLQAGHGARAAQVRSEQVAELRALLADTTGPALVLGDFNFYDDLATDRATVAGLHALGLEDANASLGTLAWTHSTEPYRLDRVFIRDGEGVCVEPQRSEVVDEGAASDHRAVQVSLKLTRRARVAETDRHDLATAEAL